MARFKYTTIEELKNTHFGGYLLDITGDLGLPVPEIIGRQLEKFSKEGCWGMKLLQPGRKTEPKTDDIVIRNIFDGKETGIDTLMQDLIARLCGRHYEELRNHYSHPFGRRNDEGCPLEYTEESRKSVKPMRLYLQALEKHVKVLEGARLAELDRNDELCSILEEKDVKIQELEEMIKAQEEKLQAQDKKFKSQEKRIRERNKQIREQKEKLEMSEAMMEVDYDMIKKLRAEKRDLQEKNKATTKEADNNLVEELQSQKKVLQEKIKAMAKEVKDYKAALVAEGYTIEEEEEEVDDMEE